MFAITSRRWTLLLPLLAVLALAGPVSGQDATRVEGRVIDAGNGSPLAAVTVRVLGTDRMTLTDAEGRFRLTRLPLGARSFAFQTIGYRSVVIEAEIRADEPTMLDVALTSAPLALEGVVVTSQKRQQAVQDVPISITVHDGEFLETSGVQEFDQLSAYTPGLEVQLQSQNNPGFVVRGITSDDGDARVQSRVSVFQDGVSISRARASVVELFDMERVEVLKGPQGTLFGRGAEIGAVHLIQNKAQDESSWEVSLGPGTQSEWYARGYGNTPIIEDKLFARVAGVVNSREGYVDNLAGQPLNGKETRAFRGLLKWTPTELTDIDLIFNWQDDNAPGTAFKSGIFRPAPDSSRSPFSPASLGEDARFEDLFVDRSVWGVTALADQVLTPAWTVQAIAAYREFDSYESFDADGTGAPALQFAEDADGTQYSLEIRGLFNNGGRFSGFLGGQVFHEDGSQGVLFRTDERNLYPLLTRVLNVQSGGAFPETPMLINGEENEVGALPANIVDLAPLLAPDDPAAQAVARAFLQSLVGTPLALRHNESLTNFGRNTAFEAFADGTLALTDRLELTAGLRWTHETLWSALEVPVSKQTSQLGRLTGAFPNILFAPTGLAPSEEGERISREESFNSVVGRAALDFAVSRDLNLYGTVARGRRPPVIQEVDSNPVVNFEVLPEEYVWSYEIGAKGVAMNQRVQYDVAAFYYDYQDFQTDVNPEITPTGISFQTDVGQATAFGGELGLVGRVSESLSLFGNYGYINASFDDTSPTGEEQRLAGNTFRLTPEHSFSTGIGWETRLVGQDWFVRPSYTWKSRVYFEEQWQEETFLDGEAPGLYQDPYGLLNLRIGFALPDDRASFELWGSNLTDVDYIIDAGNTGLSFYAPTYIAGPPLRFGVRVTARP